jgi:hypothetical protein
VFYVLHQRINPDWVANERDRALEIVNLQKDHDNFFVLVQPLEGAFFDRKGDATFNELQKALIDQFFSDHHRRECRLPMQGLAEDYRREFEILIAQVHAIFFGAKQELSSEEWKRFLFIFYIFQKIDLKFRLGANFYTTPCKDFLDRGGSQALVELILHLYWMKEEDNQEYLSDILYNIIGASIMVRKSEVLGHRLQEALKTLDFIQEALKNPLARDAFQRVTFDGWQVGGFSVEKIEDQTAVPSLKKVGTKAEILALLKTLENKTISVLGVDGEAFILANQKIYENNLHRCLEQVELDISRGKTQHFKLNGEILQSKDPLVEALDKKMYEVLPLFQQGIFSEVQRHLQRTLEIHRVMESDFTLTGTGKTEFDLSVEEERIFLKAYNNYQLIFHDNQTPLAVIRADVHVDFSTKQVNLSWCVKSVVFS